MTAVLVGIALWFAASVPSSLVIAKVLAARSHAPVPVPEERPVEEVRASAWEPTI
jgi:hypothetical protein